MNINVYHNNDQITQYVISYDREHNICTGIGELSITMERTIPRTFEPWDSIDIHENGDFKVRYFVSDILDSIPDGIITLQCQDMSKRLVDYFIPRQYTVEGPTYTRYWIEKFLDEAGISYSFLTASQGNLVSNYTTLGLTSGYDQIIQLLQLSGWYMYFDGNGVAIIGSLNTDLSQRAGSYNSTDIIEISVIKHDKMLRNRAVVWGAFDPLKQQYAFADVSVRTRWNYNAKDKRAVVISNSNIPNLSSAFGIANQLLTEFAKITVEKHLILHGARDLNLGQIVSINSNLYYGNGMITTFGISMSSGGLTTRLVLDERCPRLFGFFNFGDYVYISTFGSGIWRKHIQFDPTWYDFSSGITDLNIADLHIKDGIFGSVGSSGGMFYANSELGPWNEIEIPSLPSSQEDVVASGGAITYVTFSGIHGKATIVDKTTNNVKFAVSTLSGIGYGDYFLDSAVTASGITESGIIRSWIVECNPFTGSLVGGIGSGIYPIHYSGNYGISVLDIENDGISDFVSVQTESGFYASGYDFGSFTTRPNTVRDYNNRIGFTYSSYGLEGETLYTATPGTRVAVIDNELNDERDIVCFSETGGNTYIKIEHFYSVFSVGLGRDRIVSETQTSPPIAGTGLISPQAGIKVSPGVYRIIGTTTVAVGTSYLEQQVKYIEWNKNSNTISGPTYVTTIIVEKDIDPEVNGVEEIIGISSHVVAGSLHLYGTHTRRWFFDVGAPAYPSPNYIEIERVSVNLQTLAVASITGRKDFEDGGEFPSGVGWGLDSPTPAGGMPSLIFQRTTESVFCAVMQEKNGATTASSSSLKNWFLEFGNAGLSATKFQETNSTSDPNFIYDSGHPSGSTTLIAKQLTENNCMYIIYNTGNDTYFKYNGVDYTTGVDSTISDVGTVRTINGGSGSSYITKRGTDWFWANSTTFEDSGQISMPAGYTISNPFITMDWRRDCVFWLGVRNSDSKRVILILSSAGLIKEVITPYSASLWNITGLVDGVVAGNFFLNSTGTSSSVLYVDNVYPGAGYLVLQREEMDYNLIEEEIYPIRLDISNYAPLLTVGSGEDSFVTSYVSDTFVDQIIYESGAMQIVEDYRYTYLESPLVDAETTTSGLGIQTMGLYVVGSGVFGQDISSYPSGFQELYSIPSGYGSRIETSNYGVAGQYIFVATSGDYPTFYQKDPTDLVFVEYSGIPTSRVTRIRLDDRI